MPRHKFWVLTPPPKNCAWAASKYSGHHQTHLAHAIGAVWEKRCRHYLFLYHLQSRFFFFFFWAKFCQKATQKKMVATSPKEKRSKMSPRQKAMRVKGTFWMHNVNGRFVTPFWSNHNHLIRQKFSIPRLEVAKDITWWGRCIITWYPSLAARLQRLAIASRLGNDKSSNLEAWKLIVYFNWWLASVVFQAMSIEDRYVC